MKLIKKLIYLAFLIGVCVAFYRLYSGMAEAEANAKPLTPEERAARSETQRKQSIAIRLLDLEKTNGHGRERLDKDVENAARILYNTRHGANLPLVPNYKRSDGSIPLL